VNIQTVLESLKNYKTISTAILVSHLKGQHDKSNVDAVEIKSLLNIMNLTVSRESLFSDCIWYFPEARKKAAKTLASTRFRIDFGSYEYIPETIVFQLKLVTLMALLLPQSEIPNGNNKNKSLKVQSVVPMFRGFLSYLNHVFSGLNKAFGSGVVSDNFQSMEMLKRNHYVDYSDGFETTTAAVKGIERAFSFFQAERVHKMLFSQHLSFPRLRQTKAVITNSAIDDRKKILPDHVFEKLSAISGYIIVDFLSKLGVEVADQKSSDLMRNFPFDMGAARLINIDWVALDNYTMLRLASKNYPYDTALQDIDDASNLMTGQHGVHFYRAALQEYFGNTGAVGEIQEYLDLVYRAAVYMLGQYTGMRPSELVEVRLDTPLVDSFGVPCIVSHLKKHQDSERMLFDDKWVCIPAMVDALSAARIISRTRANPYLLSKAETTPFGVEPTYLAATGLKYVLKTYFQQVVPNDYDESSLFPYVLRHTLAYQLFRADLGLPFISHQLKHFGNLVNAFSAASNKGFSIETLGYGEIGEILSGSSKKRDSFRHKAEIEAVKAAYDPDANYAGVNGDKHARRMMKIFQGYQASGYTKDEIFEAMAEQGMAIANVGTGMCYGGKSEDFDESLPCIGGLRCNPVRCSNAVVTQAHIPKWREVYIENMKVVESGGDGVSSEQAQEAANEARMVLASLGAL